MSVITGDSAIGYTPGPCARSPLMQDASRRHVDATTQTLSQDRCLIENTHVSNAVQYAHCLARGTPCHIIDHLEYVWGKKHFTFNVDTRYNIIRLSLTLHRLFDRKSTGWFLLPERMIIEMYRRGEKSFVCEEFPEIDEGVYKYTLVAHKTMFDVPIHRQKSPPPEGPIIPGEDDFTLYSYPYHDFPTITSHLHPKYVICHGGAKLQGRLYEFNAPQERVCAGGLQDMMLLWLAWTQLFALREEFLNFQKTYHPGYDRGGDTNSVSQATRRNRGQNTDVGALPLPDREGSPTPSGNRAHRVRDYNRSVDSDADTLQDFDDDDDDDCEHYEYEDIGEDRNIDFVDNNKKKVASWLANFDGVTETPTPALLTSESPS